MILTRLRSLTVPAAEHPRGQSHISSASGLVCIGQWAHVIGDDELQLGVFALHGSADGRLVHLLDGPALPADKAARKAAKPDLEALFVTPPFDAHPHGALMAFGSGSRGTRHRAAWRALDPAGRPLGLAREASLEGLYGPLHRRFAELNIEGAFVDHDHLRLLQRGHAGRPENASILFEWPRIADWLNGGDPPDPSAIHSHELGAIDGVPLCFTDGAAMSGGAWVFCAVAENTASTFDDGRCVGAALGTVGADGQVQVIRRLDMPWKVEGISAVRDPLGWHLRLVTDADDPDEPSVLYEAHWR